LLVCGQNADEKAFKQGSTKRAIVHSYLLQSNCTGVCTWQLIITSDSYDCVAERQSTVPNSTHHMMSFQTATSTLSHLNPLCFIISSPLYLK
jgi:hypothetical protein